VTVVKPIVYGNVARYFGKKREEDGHTHQWTIYVKPYRNEVRTFVCIYEVFWSDVDCAGNARYIRLMVDLLDLWYISTLYLFIMDMLIN